MNRPQRRNALSLEHMRELIAAFRELAGSDALGIVLAGNGPVCSAGHDFVDVAGADLPTVRSLLLTCTELMTLIQQVPQPVVARVHGLARRPPHDRPEMALSVGRPAARTAPFLPAR